MMFRQLQVTSPFSIKMPCMGWSSEHLSVLFTTKLMKTEDGGASSRAQGALLECLFMKFQSKELRWHKWQ